MTREFAETDGWYVTLNHVYSVLFPPTTLELLEGYRCQLPAQDRRATFSKKTLKAVVAVLYRSGKDNHTAEIAELVQHKGTTFAVVVLEAIQALMPLVDSLEGVEPVPLNGYETVRFCLSRLA